MSDVSAYLACCFWSYWTKAEKEFHGTLAICLIVDRVPRPKRRLIVRQAEGSGFIHHDPDKVHFARHW
jgi:hypothetical protein